MSLVGIKIPVRGWASKESWAETLFHSTLWSSKQVLTRSLICCVGLIKTLLICWMIILDCEHWYWRVGKSSLKWLILLTLTLETKSEENDHEVKFQEIKSHIFQEGKRSIRRSKVLFIRKSKVSIIFANFVLEVQRTIRRSKVKINFQSPDQFVCHKYDQEMESWLKWFLNFWSPENFCKQNFDHEIKTI